MQRIPSPAGAMVSYDKYGSGLPLVLVHGAFSDHKTNWEPGEQNTGGDWDFGTVSIMR